MAWNRMKIALAAIPFLLLLSCGTDPRGYNDATDPQFFRVIGVEGDPDNYYNAFPVVTDDSGCDGEADTGDTGEGDHWPDIFCEPGENVIVYTPWDLVSITVQNFGRPGEQDCTDELLGGCNLYVLGMTIDAYDDNWQQHDFAPQLSMDWTGGSTIGVGGISEMVKFPLTRATFKQALLEAMNESGAVQGPLWTWHFMITVIAVDDYGKRYYAHGAFTIPYLNWNWDPSSL